MTDRELLELAAKAAGLHIDDWNCDMAVMYFWDGDPQNPERNHHYWSPLTDDGDALPAATGLIDSWSWLMFGETRSWIEWEEGRVAVAWAFLFPALGCAMAARGMRNAADR